MLVWVLESENQFWSQPLSVEQFVSQTVSRPRHQFSRCQILNLIPPQIRQPVQISSPRIISIEDAALQRKPTSKIITLSPLTLSDVGRGAFFKHFAVDHNIGAIAGSKSFSNIVIGNENSDARLAQA